MLGAFDCEEGRNFNLPQKMKWTTHSSKIVTKLFFIKEQTEQPE